MYHRIDGILLASSTFQLFRERLSEKMHATIPKSIACLACGILVLLVRDSWRVSCDSWDSCARDTFLTCIPSLPVAPPPNQHSTPTLMPPATQATIGIVDSFESTVLQRNLREWHERPWTYVCHCWRKTTKVGSTASVSGTVYLSYPFYLSGLSRAHFFPTTFIKIAVW